MAGETTPERDDQEKLPIDFSAYAFKFSTVVDVDSEVPEPRDDEAIWPHVKRQLLHTTYHAVAIPAETLKACRAIVRGIGNFLPAVNKRIAQGRAKADTQEDQRQAEALERAKERQALPAGAQSAEADELHKPSMVVSAAALGSEELQQFLEGQCLKGNHVSIRERPDGMIAIIITKPEAGPGAEAAIDDWKPPS